jgi:uncharacterized membrane protein HdeD (DUF308 family)
MVRAGLARVARLFLFVTVASGAVALALGTVLGAGAARSVSVGWYLAGIFLLLTGFVTSSRGPTRSTETGSWSPISLGGRSLRWATRSEQEESLNLSAVLVVLGFVLIVLGVVVDPRHPLL